MTESVGSGEYWWLPARDLRNPSRERSLWIAPAEASFGQYLIRVREKYQRCCKYQLVY